MTRPHPARLEAVRFGRAAESLCATRLTLSGYRVLTRGYRVPVGEIDIVARRRDLLVFVEVKARAVLDDAMAAVAPQLRPGGAGDVDTVACPSSYQMGHQSGLSIGGSGSFA